MTLAAGQSRKEGNYDVRPNNAAKEEEHPPHLRVTVHSALAAAAATQRCGAARVGSLLGIRLVIKKGSMISREALGVRRTTARPAKDQMQDCAQ